LQRRSTACHKNLYVVLKTKLTGSCEETQKSQAASHPFTTAGKKRFFETVFQGSSIKKKKKLSKKLAVQNS
jgi:hypothetical protein